MLSRFPFIAVAVLSLVLAACGDDDNKDKDNNNTCDTTNPKGKSCTEAKNCKVECTCADGKASSGMCVSNSCAEVDCADVCEDMDLGAYQNKFCFVGESSSSSGNNEGKIKLYELCNAHTDCEGYSTPIENSSVHCINYCGKKFCAKNCNNGESCGIHTCDEGIRSCIPSKYEC